MKVMRNAALVVGGWLAFFLLAQGFISTLGKVNDNKTSDFPETRGMGLDYARKVVLKQDGFEFVTAHDSTGRGRSVKDGHDWKVCDVYTPDSKGGFALVKDAGKLKHGTKIDLGVVQVDEKCGPDLRLATNGDLAYPMPNYRGYTPAEIIKAMRSEASLRFYSDVDGSSVSGREGARWRVCSQQLSEGATFFGQPIAFTAVRFDVDTSKNPPVATDLDRACPDRGWQGVKGFPVDRFPALVNPA